MERRNDGTTKRCWRAVLAVPALLSIFPCFHLSTVSAQTRAQPNLVFTIFGGVITGHSLWRVEQQPLTVLGSTGQPTGAYDTLRLARATSSSVVAGVSALYYRGPHLGLHAEIAYLGLPLDDGCIGPAAYKPDGTPVGGPTRNEQVCNSIQAGGPGGSAISIAVGATARAAPRGLFSPYVRAGVGIVNQTRSTLDMDGAFLLPNGTEQIRQIVADPSPSHTTISLLAAVGFATGLGPGYQLRLEARDVAMKLDRLLGEVNATGAGPVGSRLYHHFALTMGLDVVLEQRRGRRY